MNYIWIINLYMSLPTITKESDLVELNNRYPLLIIPIYQNTILKGGF